MKKKIYLAILTLCIALTGTACGTDTNKKADETKTEADKDQKSTGGTRLVSVKDIDKYITIGQYKGISLENVVEEITDAEVDASIEQDLQNTAEKVKDGSVEDGDIVVVDYTGLLDGKEFEGGSAKEQEITIGAGGFIPGFEDGIIGMKEGETKEVPVTFPEEYFEPTMAGKEVVFKITLHSFRRAAELTDEWVTKNTDYKNVKEYKEERKKTLQGYANEAARNQLLQSAWEAVTGTSEIKEYPKADIEERKAEFENQIKMYAKQGGMELEEYLKSQNVSKEQFDTQCQNYAEAKVKQNLIIQGIMDAENMTLEDKESMAIQNELIDMYKVKDLAELVDKYGQMSVDDAIGLLRVENFIVENANIQDKVSENGTVGVSGDGGDSVSESEETDTAEEADAGEEADTAEQ